MKIIIAHGGNIGFQGGGTNRVLAFARALAENGYDVSLVVPKPEGEIPEYANSIEIHTVSITPRSVWDQMPRAFLVSLKAKKIAKREDAILQIEHSTLGGIAALLGCSDYVLDVHDLEFDGDLYRKVPMGSRFIHYLERKAVSKAERVVVVSEPMREFMIGEWNVPEEKIEVIPNGYFAEKLDKFESSGEEEGLISFIGVLTHNVDYGKVINLAKSRRNARIYMMGDGPMRVHLQEIVGESGLDNVIVPGFLPDNEAYGILARSQVCINPRKNDLHTTVSAGVKNFDYAALGKAIATDRDGTARIFEEHDAALVSDPANPDEFVENVHRLLDDDSLRRKLGETARRLVRDFTWKKQGERLVRVYEKVGL